MGGLGFIFGILLTIGVVYGLFHSSAPEVLGPQQMAAGMLVLFLAFGNGLIGFLDDFIDCSDIKECIFRILIHLTVNDCFKSTDRLF